MTRLLLLIAVGVVAYAVLRRILGQAMQRPPRETQHYAPMVTCVACGVHLPESTAIRSGGRYYCSAAHAATEPR